MPPYIPRSGPADQALRPTEYIGEFAWCILVSVGGRHGFAGVRRQGSLSRPKGELRKKLVFNGLCGRRFG